MLELRNYKSITKLQESNSEESQETKDVWMYAFLKFISEIQSYNKNEETFMGGK